MSEVPDKCPACGGKIKFSSSTDDTTKSGWSCSSCNAFSFAVHDNPEITKGKRMSSRFDKVHCMDKSITKLPCDVQIGILRERQRKEEEENER